LINILIQILLDKRNPKGANTKSATNTVRKLCNNSKPTNTLAIIKLVTAIATVNP